MLPNSVQIDLYNFVQIPAIVQIHFLASVILMNSYVDPCQIAVIHLSDLAAKLICTQFGNSICCFIAESSFLSYQDHIT